MRSNSDPLIQKIENIFYAHTRKQNPVVLIEDWELVNYQSKSEALDQKGERGLLMYLGHINNVNVIPIDYARKDIYSFLCDHYNMDDINLFIFLYQVKNRLINKDYTISEFKNVALKQLRASFDWAGIPYDSVTYEYLDNLYTKQFYKSIYEERDKSPFDYLIPLKSKNIYSEIFMKYHSIRDSNFLYQICVHAFEGNDVLVILGQDHALFGHKFLSSILEV